LSFIIKKKKLIFIRKSILYQKLKNAYLRVRPVLRYYFNKRGRDKIFGENIIFIYNHIPKCGGISFLVTLKEFFCLIEDYPPQVFYFDKENGKEELKRFEFNTPYYLRLKPYQVLAGNYFSPMYSLSTRYPQVLQIQRIKLLIFL
tara:strand:+ start:110343 stop:110777 length:435 start_codon:yes stop_codon:yes gene_type:complete